jgi:hypothetical protein
MIHIFAAIGLAVVVAAVALLAMIGAYVVGDLFWGGER